MPTNSTNIITAASSQPADIERLDELHPSIKNDEINVRRIRSVIWLGISANEAKELMEVVLSNPGENPIYQAMQEAGSEYLDRLILDYMWSTEITSSDRLDKNATLAANLQKYQTQQKEPLCFGAKNFDASNFVLLEKSFHEFNSGIAGFIAEKLWFLNNLLAWDSTYARALILDAAIDNRSGLGDAMLTPTYSWAPVTHTKGRFKAIYNQSLADIAYVKNSFLAYVQCYQPYMSQQLQPYSISGTPAYTTLPPPTRLPKETGRSTPIAKGSIAENLPQSFLGRGKLANPPQEQAQTLTQQGERKNSFDAFL